MTTFLSDETLRELLREGQDRGDVLLVAVCRSALFGCLDARNQLLAVFRIAERAQALGEDIEGVFHRLADLGLGPEERTLFPSGINGVKPTE